MNAEELLRKKRQLLLQDPESGKIFSAVIDKNKVSPNGQYIFIGDFFSDTAQGWYPVDFISKCVIDILNEFEPEKQEQERRSFWGRVFGRRII